MRVLRQNLRRQKLRFTDAHRQALRRERNRFRPRRARRILLHAQTVGAGGSVKSRYAHVITRSGLQRAVNDKAARIAASLVQCVAGSVHEHAAEYECFRVFSRLGVNCGRTAVLGSKGIPVCVARAHEQLFIRQGVPIQFDGLFKTAP